MKPSLVLLHGWGAHHRVWDDLSGRLGMDINVLTPDWPAWGDGSAQSAMPYTMAYAVDRLAAAAPAQCIVAGWSLGGQMALDWARRYPQQVTRLALIAATPRFLGAPDWLQGMAPEVFAGFAASVKLDAAAALRRFMLLQAQGDIRVRTVARQLETALALQPRFSGGVLAATLSWLQVNDLRASLAEIAQPALVIHGDRDQIAPPAAGEYLAAHLPRARLALLAGVAHVPFFSVPDVIGQLMNGFCNE